MMMRGSLVPVLAAFLFAACGQGSTAEGSSQADSTKTDAFQWEAEQFADIRVLRYQVPGWDQLSLQQKKLCYYLNMAGLAGRDIMYDQNYKHNLRIRRALESILNNYKGERSGADWDAFLVYAKALLDFNVGAASAGGIVAVILANIVAIFLVRMIGKNLEA